MNAQGTFLLDSSIWGWVYRLLRPLEWLMTHILNVIHKGCVLLGMPEVGFSWVIAIIGLVLIVHACIFPAYYSSMSQMRHMQALQPKIKKIQNKYKGRKDPASREAMSRELSKLYKDNNANPMGSCLPMLFQGPVFMCMFYVLSVIPYIANGTHDPLGAFDLETAQSFSATTIFGVHMTDTFRSADTSGRIVIAIFIVLMCTAMWYMQFNNLRKNLARATMEGPQYKVQKAVTWLFPIMYIFSGVSFPIAVLVYWLTNNIANLARSLWQVYAMPTPDSPAAEEKAERDHRHENARRARLGLPSLEEERLMKAKEMEEQRQEHGFQREQPKRKNRKK